MGIVKCRLGDKGRKGGDLILWCLVVRGGFG